MIFDVKTQESEKKPPYIFNDLNQRTDFFLQKVSNVRKDLVHITFLENDFLKLLIFVVSLPK